MMWLLIEEPDTDVWTIFATGITVLINIVAASGQVDIENTIQGIVRLDEYEVVTLVVDELRGGAV